MTLKEKAISGITWSFIDNFACYAVQFIIGIVLARLLSPREFGLVGMLTLFFALSQSFIVSGFSQALIRKQNVTNTDYSTVFYFNFVVAAICYLVLFLGAGWISMFFNEPLLKSLVQVLGLTLIIDSASIIHRTILSKRIDFKLQAKISVIVVTASGLIGIIMAYFGYGVWSLVIRSIMMASLTSILLWSWNNWKPMLVFSIMSFKDLFSFGSKLLISSLLENIFKNIYFLVIGKCFSAAELGYYTKANQFQSLPSQNISGVIERVSYPVLSSIKEDNDKFKLVFKNLLKSTMLVTFILMLGMAASAKSLILTLIGEKWQPSVIYLQLLCFSGMFYPLHALNLNILNVQGRSDFFLRLEIIKKIITIPTIVIGVLWGIKVMLYSIIASNIIGYYLNSYWSGQLAGYSFIQQIKDIFPTFFLATAISSIIFLEGFLCESVPIFLLLVIQILTGIFLTFALCEWFQLYEYIHIKEIVKEKVKKQKGFTWKILKIKFL